MKRLVPAMIALAAILCSCGGNGSDVGPDPDIQDEILTVSLPGTVTAPEGDTISVPPETRVLVYYWLPLEKHPAMEEDLLYLAAIDSSVLVLPVQLDVDSRNHAQRLVNGLEVSMAVYLADSVLGSTLQVGVLPVTVLYLPGDVAQVEEGFGGPLRLLGESVLRVPVDEEVPVDTMPSDSLGTELQPDSTLTDSTDIEAPQDSLTME